MDIGIYWIIGIYFIILVLRTSSIGLSANSFRFYFTERPALLFAFPSRYLFTIGRKSYLALEDGSPGFPQCICTVVLRNSLGYLYVLYTRLSLSLAGYSTPFYYSKIIPCRAPATPLHAARKLQSD